MQAYRDNEEIVLRLGRHESTLLRRILQQVCKHYETHPSRLDQTTHDTWYSTRGCLSSEMNPEETMEWLEQLHQFRGSHLGLINQILAASGRREEDGEATVRLADEEAPRFLTVLNDHRLLVAAQSAIGQKEMDMAFFQAIHELEPAQQMALCEIELLAQIMETVLHLLPNSGSDWRKHISDEDIFD